MKLYSVVDHPLRVYIDSDKLEINRFISAINAKYTAPETEYTHNSEEELSSILFYDEDIQKYYTVIGLVHVLYKEALSLGINCQNTLSSEERELIYPEIDKYLLDGICLRDYQIEGISSALAHEKGLIQVHTGGGKTEMMVGVSRYLLSTSDMNILICVPTTNLLYQTYERMKERGISEDHISLLGDGNRIDPDRRVLIATVQSAYQKLDHDDSYMEWLSSLGCLMMDEAHHSKCRTWSTLIDRVAPRYLLGFTAEPFHKDKNHIVSDLVLRGLIGPVIHRVTMDYLINHGYLSKPYVIALDSIYRGNIYTVIDWAVVNKSCIIKNKLRNELIRDVSSLLIDSGRRPLILVQQIAHGQEIASMISAIGYTTYMMKGGRNISIYSGGSLIDNYVDNDNRVIKDFDEGKIDALIGTSTLDEGVDIPSLSAVILAGGGKGRLKTIQRIGRGLRPKSVDNTTVIVDFRDKFNVVTKSQFTKRKSFYDEMGMPVYYVSDMDSIVKIMKDFSESVKNG